MHKKILTGFVVALAMAPAFAFAESTDTQSQIQALLAQIQALQLQLKNIVASSSVNMDWKFRTGSSTGDQMNYGQMGKMACVTINRNLRQGDQGDDVRNLQQLLANDPESGFAGSATGFFGPLTMKAMAKFQMHMGIASSTDGSVGPMTRGFFERKCGKGLDGMQGGQGMGGNTNGGWSMMTNDNILGSVKDAMGKMQGGGMMQVAMVRGTISAVSGSTITVQTDGGSTVVNVTSTTTIKVWNGTSTPATDGTIANLIVGKKVMAGGTKNADGSILAMKIAVGDTLPMEGMPQTMNLNLNGSLVPQIKSMVEDFMKDFKGGQGPNGKMPTMQMWQNGEFHGTANSYGGVNGQDGAPGASY